MSRALDSAGRAAQYGYDSQGRLTTVTDPRGKTKVTNGNFVLGDERFQARMGKALGQRVVRGKPGRPAQQGQSPDEMQGGVW